ncbi:MAG: tetratricopeptide repeat protein [Candidatus Omnitrophica bacterium]|nr:tetratricopeptide repeat protein [Candidatus Omnitrophota bacterium]
MSDLYSLSKKLKVRAEILRKRLEEETGQPVSISDTIPEDQVAFLEKAFERPSAAKKWLKQIGEKIQPTPSSVEETPEPTTPEEAEPEPPADVDADLIAELMGSEFESEPQSESEPELESELEVSESVPEEEDEERIPALFETPEETERFEPEETVSEIDLEEIEEPPTEEPLVSAEAEESEPPQPDLEAIESFSGEPPIEEEDSTGEIEENAEDLAGLLDELSPETEEEEPSPTADLEASREPSPEEEDLRLPEFTESEPVEEEMEEGLGVFSELDRFEEIRERLPSEAEDFDFIDIESEIAEELEDEEDEEGEDSGIAGSFLDQPLTELDEEEEEPVTSEDLQEMVDNLFQGMPAEDEEEVARPDSVFHKTVGPALDFWEALEPKEKSLLKAGATMSILLIAGALYWSSVKYGKGADLRLYQSGVRSQKEGDLETAESTFNDLLRRYPKSPLTSETSFRIAEILREEEDYINSSRAMNQGLEILGRNVEEVTGEWTAKSRRKLFHGFHFLGEIHALREDWSNAAEKFEEVIQNATGDPIRNRSLYQYADVLYEMARPKDADTSLLRNIISAYGSALDASAETVRILPAYLRLSKTWERLADREKGQKLENLGKSLAYMKKLRDFGKGAELVGLEPKEVDLEIARLLREMGQTEESIALLRKVIALPRDEFLEGPLPHKYRLALARSLLQNAEEMAGQGRDASAERQLYEVLEIARPNEQNPFEGEDETEAVYLRGHAYYNLGVLLATKNGDPRNSHFTKMVAAYQSALDQNDSYGKNGHDSLLALLRRTNYLYDNAEQYNDAVREYTRILEEFPDNPYAYRVQYKLGEALYRLNRYAEAEKHFRDAVRDFPRTQYTDDESFRGSYFGLATCQYLEEDYARAAQTYETLLSLVQYEDSPESLLAWKRLADAYHQQGLIDESIDELRGFLKKYPTRDDNGLVRFQLARNLFERFDYGEGREELRKIIEELPRDSETVRWAHYLICKSYQDESGLAVGEDRKELLMKVLDEAEKIRIAYPDEDRPLAIMGLTYFDLGDYERSAKYLEYYNQASRTEDPKPENQLKLAESFFRLKRYKEAIPAYRRVDLTGFEVGGREEAARTLFNLAESLRYEDRLVEAVANYEKILEDYPTSTLRELAQGRINELQWRISKGISRQANP